MGFYKLLLTPILIMIAMGIFYYLLTLPSNWGVAGAIAFAILALFIIIKILRK